MKIPDICNVLSTSGKEFSLSHWYSPIIDSWVTKIEVQRKHLFQIFRIYWIDSLFNMQVFWDLRMQWSNCPYFVAKKDLHWIYLVEKGKSGYSCQDAKFRSTPKKNECWGREARAGLNPLLSRVTRYWIDTQIWDLTNCTTYYWILEKIL